MMTILIFGQKQKAAWHFAKGRFLADAARLQQDETYDPDTKAYAIRAMGVYRGLVCEEDIDFAEQLEKRGFDPLSATKVIVGSVTSDCLLN